jgi:hypothetical protein
MIRQSENRIEHLGTTIIFILCLFFLASLHQNYNNPDFSGAFRFQMAPQHSFAIQTKDIPQLSSLQGFISKFEEMNYIHFTEQLKLVTDNKLTNQRIGSLHKVALLIKPIYQEFYYHQQSLSSEDISILS